ncbi:hypothetical protein [Maridesulfovibrio bastinii]|uniref:hypothetical protein n=1 Tax=Maridesulfovibrio bastinii TaxID=47157 RepID=UPI000416C88E|nr:hypothetical protein [Maridesulfovibrio bastinii]
MKKTNLLLLLALTIFFSACALPSAGNRYGENAQTFTVALLPWHTTQMNFDYKYTWTMTQGLIKAAAQAGNFKVISSAYYAYPGYGISKQDISSELKSTLWVRHKYGKYMPDKKTALSLVKASGAQLGILYDVSADNGSFDGGDSTNTKSDSIRIFIVDASSETIVSAFIRTDFLRGQGFIDAKQVTLNGFDELMNSLK